MSGWSRDRMYFARPESSSTSPSKYSLRLVGVPRGLRHGDVGRRAVGVAGELGLLELALGGVDVGHRRPQVDDHEVGLVALDRVDGRLTLLGVLHALVVLQKVDAVDQGTFLVAGGRLPPGVPVDASQVVERVPPHPSVCGGSLVMSVGFGRTVRKLPMSARTIDQSASATASVIRLGIGRDADCLPPTVCIGGVVRLCCVST